MILLASKTRRKFNLKIKPKKGRKLYFSTNSRPTADYYFGLRNEVLELFHTEYPVVDIEKETDQLTYSKDFRYKIRLPGNEQIWILAEDCDVLPGDTK